MSVSANAAQQRAYPVVAAAGAMIDTLDGAGETSGERVGWVPVVGFVTAGAPLEALENIEGYQPIPLDEFDLKPTYLLRVKGESMRDAGIGDGDLIAVHRCGQARNNQIVVARVRDEVTVKTLKTEGERPCLQPENPAYEPLFVAPEDLAIEGLFVGLIRNR